MTYVVKVIAGLALFAGGVALFNVKLVELLEIGACDAGDQPLAVDESCPELTRTLAGLMAAGLFAALVGGSLLTIRGRAPWRDREAPEGFRAGLFAWGAFFAATGATAVITVLTNEAFESDGELGVLIVGGVFVAVGLLALGIWLWIAISERGSNNAPPAEAEPEPDAEAEPEPDADTDAEAEDEDEAETEAP